MYSKIFLIFLLSLNLYSDNLVVVVSKSSTINSISKKDLSRIFLSKTKRFPNGQKAIAIELDNKIYQSIFYEKISNKNSKQLKKYWSKMIFTGVAMPPKKFDSINELLDFMKNNPEAISYIPKNKNIEETKIIMEID